MEERKHQVKTIERRKYAMKYLRRGKLPKDVIEMVMEEYGIAYDTAYQLVYAVNKEINDNLKELAENAANYLMNNVQSLAAASIEDGDKKTALKSYELLAKICKIGQEDNKTDININFGFDFEDDDRTDKRS